VCDFDGLRNPRLFVVLNGDLQPATMRGHLVQLSPQLYQIERGRGRRGLPFGNLNFPVSRLRDLQHIHFFSHEFVSAIHVPREIQNRKTARQNQRNRGIAIAAFDEMTLTIRIMISAAWMLTAATGAVFISNYESTPGATDKTPAHWPEGTQIALDSKRDTLVMFVHPKCPCTRASMEELNQLLGQHNGQIAAHIFFFRPANFPKDWVQTDLWRSAAAIPGVTSQEDIDGATARQFGAETSGFTVLYSPRGELLFKGGITDGRGHIGDNPGKAALVSLARGETAAVTQTPVYGCKLPMDGNCKTLAETTPAQ
jgi:hypothetical protein